MRADRAGSLRMHPSPTQRMLRLAAFATVAALSSGRTHAAPPATGGVAVGAQYDTTHVYVAPADLDRFVDSFTATFGGKAAPAIEANVLPVPSRTRFRAVRTPVGGLSVFAFETPVPYQFGQERTGYLVTDIDDALKQARAAGADVVVAKFKDAIGYDAVVQWPGALKMQLYWHFEKPSAEPLAHVPDNRVYLSPDAATRFIDAFTHFSHGRIVSDTPSADAGEIGRPGERYRRIRIESTFGRLQVNVTDGHLPYPFGWETTGYEVDDLDATLRTAVSSGAQVLSPAFAADGRRSAVIQFPGGYVAEVHAAAR